MQMQPGFFYPPPYQQVMPQPMMMYQQFPQQNINPQQSFQPNNNNINNNTNNNNDDQAFGIYISNLAEGVTEELLYMIIQQFCKIKQIKLPREIETKKSKGYAFIHFNTEADALQVRKELNYEKILDKQIRIAVMLPPSKINRQANIFVKDVNPAISGKQFEDFFSKWGKIISSKLKLDKEGNSLGYGYVQFEQYDQAIKCLNECTNPSEEIKDINNFGTLKQDGTIKPIVVQAFHDNKDRPSAKNNIFLREYNKEYTKEQMDDEHFIEEEKQNIEKQLTELLKQFGEAKSICVKFQKEYGKPFAFVCFNEANSAQKAMQALKDPNFQKFFSYINWAMKRNDLTAKENRELDLRYIFIKNLKKGVTEQQIKNIFGEKYHRIFSVRIREPNPTTVKANSSLEGSAYCSVKFCQLEDAQQVIKDKEQIKEYIINTPELKEMFKENSQPFISNFMPKENLKEYKDSTSRGQFQKQPFQPIGGRGNKSRFPFQAQGQRFPPFDMFPPFGGYPMHFGFPPPNMRPRFPPMGMPFQGFPPRPYQQRRFMPQRPQYNRPPFNQNMPPQNQPPQFQNQPQQFQNQPPQFQNSQQAGQIGPIGQIQQQLPVQQQMKQNFMIPPQTQLPLNQNQFPPQQQFLPGQPPFQNVPQNQVNTLPNFNQLPGQAPNQLMQQNLAQQTTNPQIAPVTLTFAQQIKQIKDNLLDFESKPVPQKRQLLGQLIYPKVVQYCKNVQNVPKVTGMLIDFTVFDVQEILEFLEDEQELTDRIKEAEELLNQENKN